MISVSIASYSAPVTENTNTRKLVTLHRSCLQEYINRKLFFFYELSLLYKYLNSKYEKNRPFLIYKWKKIPKEKHNIKSALWVSKLHEVPLWSWSHFKVLTAATFFTPCTIYNLWFYKFHCNRQIFYVQSYLNVRKQLFCDSDMTATEELTANLSGWSGWQLEFFL